MAAAEWPGQVSAIEPGEVHLHLVGRTAQGRDRCEVLARQFGQLVDQQREVADGQRFHAALGIGHRRAIARLQVVAPFAFDDGKAVANGRRHDPRDVARIANRLDQHPGQAAAERATRDEIDRVEIPAIDHDVVRPRCDLTDHFAEERMHAVLHGRQQPGLEERSDRLANPLACAPISRSGRTAAPRSRSSRAAFTSARP